MTPTAYRLPPEVLAAVVDEKRAALKANRGFSDLLGFALSIVSDRLAKDRRRYLDYGPYWWALKAILQRHDYHYGTDADDGIMAAYTCADEVSTVVAADLFRDEYLDTRIVGERRYHLDPEETDWWDLLDEDME